MTTANAVLPPLSEEECEQIYLELTSHLGRTAGEMLTQLHNTQRELRQRCPACFEKCHGVAGSKVLLPLDAWKPFRDKEGKILRWEPM